MSYYNIHLFSLTIPLSLVFAIRRTPCPAGSVRSGGQARAGLLADQRARDQGVLLAALPLLHRESEHPELFQPQPQVSGRGRGHRRAQGLEADPVEGLDGARVPQDFQARHG